MFEIRVCTNLTLNVCRRISLFPAHEILPNSAETQLWLVSTNLPNMVGIGSIVSQSVSHLAIFRAPNSQGVKQWPGLDFVSTNLTLNVWRRISLVTCPPISTKFDRNTALTNVYKIVKFGLNWYNSKAASFAWREIFFGWTVSNHRTIFIRQLRFAQLAA